MEFLQASSLTTGIDEFVGNGADNTITAGTVNEVTGADITTITVGDSIDGGAGTDTLNISVTSEDNTSLAGLSVENVEVVNITGANYLGAGQGALAAATAANNVAKAAYNSALAVQEAGLKYVTSLATLEAALGTHSSNPAVANLTIDNDAMGETMLNAFQVASSTADLVGMARAAYVVAQTLETGHDEQTEITDALKLSAADFKTDVLEATGSIGGFTQAQYNKVLNMIRLDLNEVPVADNALAARAEVVENAIDGALLTTLTGQYGSADLAGINAALGAIAASTDFATAGISTLAALAKMTPSTAAAVATAHAALSTSTTASEAAHNTAATLATSIGASNGYSFAQLLEASSILSTYTATKGTAATIAADSAELAVTAAALAPILNDSTTEGDTGLLTADYNTYSTTMLADGNTQVIQTPFSRADVSFADLKDAVGDLTFTDLEDSASDIVAEIDELMTIAGSDLATIKASVSETKAAAISTGNALELAEAAVSSASVSASSFDGAEQVWVKGDSGDVAISAGADQIIGFASVAAMDNTVTTAAVSPTFAISGSKGDLEVKSSKATSMNFIGTGGEVAVSLTKGSTATNELTAVTSSASGTLTLDLTSLTDLETVTANGEGGLVIEGVSDTVATVTTGEGADKLTLNTETKKDVASTSKDETVTAALESGDGADQVIVSVKGAGIASVDTGAGDDVIKVNHSSTGDVDITAGAGNDVVWLENGTAELTAKASVDGGDGIDTLAIPGDSVFSTGDYLKLTQYATSFEALLAVGAIGTGTAVDASELPDIKSYTLTKLAYNSTTFAAIDQAFEEVASGTSFTNTIYLRGEEDYLGEWDAEVEETLGARSVTIEAAGYKADDELADDDFAAEYGGDISITSATAVAATPFAAGGTEYTVNASNVQLVIAGVDLGKDGGFEQKVTLTGDMETVTVVLASARGSSTKAGAEYIADFSIATGDMQGLKALTVIGAGTVTIDASDDGEVVVDAAAENLTVINLSGMTEFANLDATGENVLSNNTTEGYLNKSTSDVTTSDQISQTVKLGGALDTVTTSSSSDYMDMIEGFALEADLDTEDDDTDIDTSVSDALVLIGTTASSSAAVVADDTEYTSIEAALIAVASGTEQNVVFHAEGNTYVFAGNGSDGNSGAAELDDGDVVVGLVGTYDLDQLINAVTVNT